MFFSPKQGLAKIKQFFSSPSDSVRVHSELNTFPSALTAVVRLCEGVG